MGRWITTGCIHPENGLNEVSRYQLSVQIFKPVQSSASKSWERVYLWWRGGERGVKQVQISLPPPPALHCLERIEFIAQEHRERENKKAFTFPIQRQSLHTDGLPPVESRAGGRCILQKKNLPTRPFLLSPLTPGNKTCKVEHAKHRIYRASPHLTRQMCGNNEVDKTSTSTACGGRGDFEKDVRMH